MSDSPRQGRLSALRRLSDEELASEATTGDQRAARVLLERHEEAVYRYSLALVRDPSIARDVAASVLLEAHRALGVGEYTEPIAPWLFKLTGAAAYLGTDRAERDQAAEIASEARGEDRSRLQALLDGLDKLGALELSALLLREIVRLDYVGIATAARSRPPVARQAVFRARLDLQGNPEPTTEHCDEIRAAMSKAEIGFRERRSIASHLDGCPVCEEFADQLEQRPEDLRTLFPPPSGSLAAELLPSMAGAAAAGAAAGVPDLAAAGALASGAGAAGAAAAAGGGGGTGGPGGRRRERGPRRRRPALVPVIVALLLLGAAVATALALQDAGGGKKGSAQGGTTAAQGPGSTQATAPKTETEKTPTTPEHKKTPPTTPEHKKTPPKNPEHRPPPKKPPPKNPEHRPPPQQKHHGGSQKHGGHGGGNGNGNGGKGGGQGQGGTERAKPCPKPAASPARSAYSGRAGAVQDNLRPCAHGAAKRGGGGMLAGTGLELSLLIAAGACLLGLGFGMRRLTRPL